MSSISRKAAAGAAAVVTAAATAFLATGSASAATAAPTARVVLAAQVTAAKPAALSWPLVVAGNKGERVASVQYLLNQRVSAGLAADGVFGAATTAGVKKFQAVAHLSVDGQVGAKTWAALIVTVQNGAKGQAVSAVQHSLHYAYGFSKLAVDGVFGPDTLAAVK